MVTFVTPPPVRPWCGLRPVGAAPGNPEFILLSVFCRWIPDIDTLSCLVPIDETTR